MKLLVQDPQNIPPAAEFEIEIDPANVAQVEEHKTEYWGHGNASKTRFIVLKDGTVYRHVSRWDALTDTEPEFPIRRTK